MAVIQVLALWIVILFLARHFNERIVDILPPAVSMAANGVQLPDYSRELINTFLEAFFEWPLHRWETAAIDLSPFALYAAICLLVSCNV